MEERGTKQWGREEERVSMKRWPRVGHQWVWLMACVVGRYSKKLYKLVLGCLSKGEKLTAWGLTPWLSLSFMYMSAKQDSVAFQALTPTESMWWELRVPFYGRRWDWGFVPYWSHLEPRQAVPVGKDGTKGEAEVWNAYKWAFSVSKGFRMLLAIREGLVDASYYYRWSSRRCRWSRVG